MCSTAVQLLRQWCLFCKRLVTYSIQKFYTYVFILQFLSVLQSAPPTPPSYAQAIRENEQESTKEYFKSLWKLMKNIHFVLIFLAYSINVAVYSAVSTFLSQMVVNIYPVRTSDFKI
jgi:predicted MFS family arabinose efflux permease